MRIADVLRERDEDDDLIAGENHRRPSFTSPRNDASPTCAAACSSSRSLVSRLFRNRRKSAHAASEGKRIEIDEIATGIVDSGERLPEIDLSSALKPNEIAFNLGMGIGMAFLLAGNTNEMKKMVALRKQIEMLLKEFKGEVKRRDDSSLYSLSDVGEDSFSTTISIQQNCSSLDMEEPKHFSESDRKSDKPVRNLTAMDQLEAEIQVELKRMQLNVEGEDAGKHKMEKKIQLHNNNKFDSSSGSSAPVCCDNMSDEDNEEQHGVSAHALERRLHELLQTRQQDRIEALESALELAQTKLREKEHELGCWKKIRGFVPENDETYFSLSFE